MFCSVFLQFHLYSRVKRLAYSVSALVKSTQYYHYS